MDNDDTNNPAIVNYFTFSNETAYALNDATITLNFADGLTVTGVKTPVSSSTMYGTTSYNYTLTLTDGSTVTGTITAGETVTDTSGKGIRSVSFVPNLWASGSTTDTLTTLTGDYGPTGQNNSSNVFIAYGSLSSTYDNGTAVARGDELTSSISLTSSTISTTTVSVTQTVIGEEDLKAAVQTYISQTSQQIGATNAGYIGLLRNTTVDTTTDQIYELIFYYVLPKGTTFDPATGTSSFQGNPTITVYAWDNREVVKVDYTGTGEYVNVGASGVFNLIYLNTDPDAIGGSYPWAVYMYSPKTGINMTAATISDTTMLDGQTGTVYEVGSGTWNINSSSIFGAETAAAGNKNLVAVENALSDDKGSTAMTFYVSVSNYGGKSITNGRMLINLPSTSNGDNFDFVLTGEVSFKQRGNMDDSAATVYYSTSYQNFTDTAVGAQVSLDGYVTADKVTDWSAIKSIIITGPEVPDQTTVGRFIISGTDPTLVNDAGKTINLNVTITADGLNPLYLKESSTITVSGSSTVTARYHYVDANGDDQYITLDDLAKTYTDNTDTMEQDDFTLTTADKALIPDGYELSDATPTIVNGSTTWKSDAENGTAAFGETVKYYFDGDIVQYELVHQQTSEAKTITKTINYYKDSVGGEKAADSATVSVTITKLTDVITGEVTYQIGDGTAQASSETTIDGVALPTVTGYVATAYYLGDGTVTTEGAATSNTDSTVTYDSDGITVNVVYTADTENATLTLIDDTDKKTLETATSSGGYGSTITFSSSKGNGDTVDAIIKHYTDLGYVEVTDDTTTYKDGLTYTDGDNAYEIHFVHGTTDKTDTKTVKETVQYVYASDVTKKAADDKTGKATFSRTITTDSVTKKVTATSDWSPSSATIAAISSPAVTGYQPSAFSVVAVTVTADSADIEQIITYRGWE